MILVFSSHAFETHKRGRGWNRSHAGYRLCAPALCTERLRCEAAPIGLLGHGLKEVLNQALRIDRTGVHRREWDKIMCIPKQ